MKHSPDGYFICGMTIPRRITLCARMKTSKVGRLANVSAAIVNCVACSCWNSYKKTIRVHSLGFWQTIKANMKAPYAPVNAHSDITARMG